VVPDDRPELAELFGGHTGDAEDKFARVAWHDGPSGVPLLDVCDSRLVGRVLWHRDAGDHDLYVLDPIEVRVEPGEHALDLERAKGIEPGHEA
jgi:flavin reductase (DIM6/NTAB) family NADH-FMN oxidoreductase RutF